MTAKCPRGNCANLPRIAKIVTEATPASPLVISMGFISAQALLSRSQSLSEIHGNQMDQGRTNEKVRLVPAMEVR
jgi:hypothetical protein